jgi:hypothetical protein
LPKSLSKTDRIWEVGVSCFLKKKKKKKTNKGVNDDNPLFVYENLLRGLEWILKPYWCIITLLNNIYDSPKQIKKSWLAIILKADLFVKLWKGNQSSISDIFWGKRDDDTWSPGEKVLENNDTILGFSSRYYFDK